MQLKYVLLSYTGGRLCSFSPCIEQVQRTCTVLRESRCFEDIETIELVHKPYKVRKTNLSIVNLGFSDPDVQQVLGDDQVTLPPLFEAGDCLSIGTVTTTSEPKAGNSRPPLKRKRRDSTEDSRTSSTADSGEIAKSDSNLADSISQKPDSREESTKTPPSFTKNAFTFKTCAAPKEIYGHTGYLTFATHCS